MRASTTSLSVSRPASSAGTWPGRGRRTTRGSPTSISRARGGRREVRQHPVEDPAGTSFSDRLLGWHLLELAPERKPHLWAELFHEPGADPRGVPDNGGVPAPQRLQHPRSARGRSLARGAPTPPPA